MPTSLRNALAVVGPQIAQAQELWARYGSQWQKIADQATAPIRAVQDDALRHAADLKAITTPPMPDLPSDGLGLMNLSHAIAEQSRVALSSALNGIDVQVSTCIPDAALAGLSGTKVLAEAAMKSIDSAVLTPALERHEAAIQAISDGMAKAGLPDGIRVETRRMADALGAVTKSIDAAGIGKHAATVLSAHGALKDVTLPKINLPDIPLPRISSSRIWPDGA